MLNRITKTKLLIIFLLIGVFISSFSLYLFISHHICDDSTNNQAIPQKTKNQDLTLSKSRLNLYGIPEEIIKSCKLEDQAVSYKSESFPTLYYENIIIGVGELSITDDITNDRVYILSKNECSIKIIKHSLSYRPISSITKVYEYTFAFTYTAQPHYGHYLEYDLNGNQVDTYPLADECYMVNQVSNNVREDYEKKCKENPQLKPFSEFNDIRCDISDIMSSINDDTHYAFSDLYTSMDTLPPVRDEFLILDDYLEKRNFAQESYEWGNHSSGPRMIKARYSKDNLSCEVTKTYYLPQEEHYDMYITEEITCNNKKSI